MSITNTAPPDSHAHSLPPSIRRATAESSNASAERCKAGSSVATRSWPALPSWTRFEVMSFPRGSISSTITPGWPRNSASYCRSMPARPIRLSRTASVALARRRDADSAASSLSWIAPRSRPDVPREFAADIRGEKRAAIVRLDIARDWLRFPRPLPAISLRTRRAQHVPQPRSRWCSTANHRPRKGLPPRCFQPRWRNWNRRILADSDWLPDRRPLASIDC